jgi:DNA processing protein
MYQIALSMLYNMGHIRAKKLVAYCGSVEAVFTEKKKNLEKIPGIGTRLATQIISSRNFKRAEQEVRFLEKYRIRTYFYLDADYPKRLSHCEDSPVMLYCKGNTDLNAGKIISIVGTRDPTDYGRELCAQFIKDLSVYDPLIVSGLAYGIDIAAHKSALDNGLDTAAVLAHGLDKIYPAMHRSTAEKIVRQGALLSDFCSGTIPDRENFPSRNRIVAGLADATIVVESKKEGGSLITADIANSYNRDVFAFPGRVTDPTSEGCNKIIRENKAALIQSAEDLIYIMGWNDQKKNKLPKQKELFYDASAEELVVINEIEKKQPANIDELCFAAKMPMSKVSAILLNLEFNGVVKSLPGKQYKLQ